MLNKVTNRMIDGASVNVKDFGAVGDGVTDDTAAIQAAIDAAKTGETGANVDFPTGVYYISSTVDIDAASINLRGEHKGSTSIVTDQDITMFWAQENVGFYDLTFRQTATVVQGKALASNTTRQWAYNVVERCNFQNFKFGIHLRYSLWLTFRDLRFTGCGCGIRLARSNSFDADRTNPFATSSWNLWNDGWFHNMLEFSSCFFEGGEVGIWGCPMGTKMDVITTQGQNSFVGPGTTRLVLPDGIDPVGILLEAGSSGSATRDVTINAFYSEASTRAIELRNTHHVTINGVFNQGGNTGSSPYRFMDSYGSRSISLKNIYASDYYDYFIGAYESSRIIYDTIAGPISAGANRIDHDETSNVREDAYSGTHKRHVRNIVLPAGTNGRIIDTGYEMEDGIIAEITIGYLRDSYADSLESWKVYRYNSAAGITIIRTDNRLNPGSAAPSVTVTGTSDSAGTYNVDGLGVSNGIFELQMNSSTGHLEIVQRNYGTYALNGIIDIKSEYVAVRNNIRYEVAPYIRTTT